MFARMIGSTQRYVLCNTAPVLVHIHQSPGVVTKPVCTYYVADMVTLSHPIHFIFTLANQWQGGLTCGVLPKIPLQN